MNRSERQQEGVGLARIVDQRVHAPKRPPAERLRFIRAGAGEAILKKVEVK